MADEYPRLRSVEKYKPPYPLNCFPKQLPLELAREVVYHIASRGNARLEGSDWEAIFAHIVGAEWKPSNVGLDDIVLGQTAWGAKSVKSSKPSEAKKVRLISGRNSPAYSYGVSQITDCDQEILGKQVIDIWNERVAGVRSKYRHLRTVVLVKSNDLLELAVFEFETILYPSDDYYWKWNNNNNLEGYAKKDDEHVFTWQPHGSQFTIIEKVPNNRLAVRIKNPPIIDQDEFLKAIKFDESWVQII